ncbi:hypothetical protein LCGC14_1177480 [marine sediment metagenome]|uniref:Uncharacterized protein n=1 Tax=marine sediment metagenome TaxID=412755 RepID=A0A0F9LT11_9ZZZZ
MKKFGIQFPIHPDAALLAIGALAVVALTIASVVAILTGTAKGYVVLFVVLQPLWTLLIAKITYDWAKSQGRKED